MNVFLIILIVLIGCLQYSLWNPHEGSLAKIAANKQQLAELTKEVEQKKLINQTMEAELLDLHYGLEALEERARNELGMIKEEETFFQIIE